MTGSAPTFQELGGWPSILQSLFRGEDLSEPEAATALGEILEGRAEPTQTAAFLAALRTKGESVGEMAGLARAMKEHGEHVVLAVPAIDTCGTGGDRLGTVNVSTMAALVACGAGISVCKHGGGASSSLSGSADVLRTLGVIVDLGPEGVAACVERAGIGFCFAPRFHPAMRHAAPVRQQLGVATIFNFLGPLCNPAGVTRQVVGVGDAAMAEKMLAVLIEGGATHALVVYGHDGLDELSTTGPSTILEARQLESGGIERNTVDFDPRSVGLELSTIEDLRGGDATFNAARARALLAGEGGPQRDFLLLNSAAALLVAGIVADLADGLELAAATIDRGAALAALERLIETSNELAPAR